MPPVGSDHYHVNMSNNVCHLNRFIILYYIAGQSKRQYSLTLQVSRYCVLALQSSIMLYRLAVYMSTV